LSAADYPVGAGCFEPLLEHPCAAFFATPRLPGLFAEVSDFEFLS